MATGRAVIVCDGRGLAGFVNQERYPAWRRENVGLRTLLKQVSADKLAAELDRYNAKEAAAVSARVREDAALTGWVAAYMALYREAIEEHEREPLDAETRAIAHGRGSADLNLGRGPRVPMARRAGLSTVPSFPASRTLGLAT